MTEEQTPIKIVIAPEDEPPLVPENNRSNARVDIRQAGRQLARHTGNATKKAWRSSARKKATGSLKKGAKALVAAGGRVIHGAVVKTTERQVKKRANKARTRLESTDWKYETRARTGRGLRWLSQSLTRLAERLAQEEPDWSQEKDRPPADRPSPMANNDE